MIAKVIEFTPNLANFGSGAYSAGDQLGAVNTLSGAVLNSKGPAELVSVSIVDKADQKQALDLYFFDESPTTGAADNAAFAATDAEMADKALAHVSIVAGDYSDYGAGSIATKSNIQLMLQAIKNSKDLYCVLVTRGTPTYGAAGDLVVRVGLKQY